MHTTIQHGPEGGVLRIRCEAGGHTVVLSGYCRYWIEDVQVGGWGCPEHLGEVGSAVSYRWTGSRFVREARMPTLDGPILEGEWVPDDEWRAVRYG